MYNPYGTFRSWVSNALIIHGASRFHPEYTMAYNLLTAEDHLQKISIEDYTRRVDQMIAEYSNSVTSVIGIMIASILIWLSINIHTGAHLDLCLELARTYYVYITDK